MGTPIEDLVDTYMEMVRSILEMAVPTWHPGLKGEDANKIERVQKFAIILGRQYSGYEGAMRRLDIEPLSKRRDTLCLKFALKAEKHTRYSKWFTPNPV